MVKFEELGNVTTKALAEINILIPQVSSSAQALSYAALLDIIKDNAITFVVARDGGTIIGFGTLAIYHSISSKRGRIDHMVIDEQYRGQGLGEKLMQKLIDIAKEHKVTRIELTSRPSREAANKLYQKMGFEIHETNFYQLKLS